MTAAMLSISMRVPPAPASRRLASRPAGGGAGSRGAAAATAASVRLPSGAGRGAGRLPASVYRRRRVVAVVLGLLLCAATTSLVGSLAAMVGPIDRHGPHDLGDRPLTVVEGRTPAPAVTGSPEPPATAVPERRLETRPVSRATYVVQSGDTLWTIARRLEPTGDVRPLVDALAAARGGRPLQPGERIVLP